MRRPMQALPGLICGRGSHVAIAPLAAQRGQQGPPARAAQAVRAGGREHGGRPSRRVLRRARDDDGGGRPGLLDLGVHAPPGHDRGRRHRTCSSCRPCCRGRSIRTATSRSSARSRTSIPEEIAKKDKNVKVDLAADVLAKYKGQPVLVASSVINKGMIDLTKRMPPPMTADDEALSTIMKKRRTGVRRAAQRRPGIEGRRGRGQGVELKQAFADTEAFWKSHGKADATGWAADARKQAEAIEKDASGGKWDAVKASAGTLGQQCQACHTAYRERFDDGSFRIKKAG